MNGFQKVIKAFAIGLAIFIILNIAGGVLFGLSIVTNIGIGEEKVVVDNFSEIYQGVKKIDIDAISSNIIIKQGNEFKVEASNLSNKFSSKLNNGVLNIKETKTWFWENNSSGIITIYIPNEANLEELKIDSGAGKIEISDIFANNFNIDHGAGILEISNSNFNNTDIDGGAGEIKIFASNLNNVKMDAGVGKVTIEADITGNSKIECGVGELNISLLGNKEDYTIKAEKGIGSIKLDNEDKNQDTIYGTGKNIIELEGGIGSINVKFLKN